MSSCSLSKRGDGGLIGFASADNPLLDLPQRRQVQFPKPGIGYDANALFHQ